MATKKNTKSRAPARRGQDRGASSPRQINSPSQANDLGNTIGSIAKVVGNIAPGPIGMLAKMAGNLFNDPSWYRRYQSGGLTTNVPLRVTRKGGAYGSSGTVPSATETRPFLLEMISSAFLTGPTDTNSYDNISVINIPEEFITTFVIPQIRHVLNAIPLQSTNDYAIAMMASATLYAVKVSLERYVYLIGHQQPVIPAALAVFPITNPANFATLQALIRRIEATLSARVRLPDILIEMLSWRYGRTYKSNLSAKSGWVLYNVLPLGATISRMTGLITGLEGVLSNVAQATADIFNAYTTHKQVCPPIPGSEIHYDVEEFVLRTNMDLFTNRASGFDPNLFIMDSDLENDPVFMATAMSAAYPTSMVAGEHADIATGLIPMNTPTAGYPKSALTTLMPITDALLHFFVPGDLAPQAVGLRQMPSMGGVVLPSLVFGTNGGTASTFYSAALWPTAALFEAYYNGSVGDAFQAPWGPIYYPGVSNITLAGYRASDHYCSVFAADGTPYPVLASALKAGVFYSISVAAATQSKLTLSVSYPTALTTGATSTFNFSKIVGPIINDYIGGSANALILALIGAKAMDLYNIDLLISMDANSISAGLNETPQLIDSTAISTDAGLVPSSVLYTTHRSTFANLVNPDYKSPLVHIKEDLAESNRLLQDLVTGK